MAGGASVETSVSELLEEDAFAAAFDEAVKPEPEAKAEPEVKTEPEAKVDEPAAKVEPEVKVDPPAKAETPAPAASATEIGEAVAKALKAAEPTKVEPTKVEPTAAAEEDTPEVKAALEDLEKNWGTHAVAVNALLEKQAKKLKAEFAEILKPIQAQIAPVVAATAETAQAQFNAALLAEHADAFTIIPDVEKWIESQPATLQSPYNKVLDEGSAADVAKFLTDYKAATGKQAPADDSAAKAAAEKAEAERLAKLDKMKQPATTRTSVTAEPDPQDFDAAFEAGAKLAAQLAA